jgi:glycosyltransferase 2 family protein
MKKWILIAARVLVAVAAMWLALRNVKWKELNQFEWNGSLFWLIPALVFFNASQFISAYRLLQFYKIHQRGLSYPFNLRLYYKGMFYNLFLPGGIGGDAYKIIALKNSENTYKQLTTATLLDRINGLVILLLIISLLTTFVSIPGFEKLLSLIPYFVLVGLPCYVLIMYYYFKPYSKLLPLTGFLSLLVQGFQLLSFYCILYSLQIDTGSVVEHAVLFFVSSVIAALPFSIGGIGTRELAMASGAAYFNISAAKMVSASLVFFVLTALSALTGWAFSSAGRKKSNAASLEPDNNKG